MTLLDIIIICEQNKAKPEKRDKIAIHNFIISGNWVDELSDL